MTTQIVLKTQDDKLELINLYDKELILPIDTIIYCDHKEYRVDHVELQVEADLITIVVYKQ